MATPSLSNRYSSIPPSPTLALNAKAKAMALEGIKVINLSVGEPDFSTPTSIIEEAEAALRKGRTRYGPSGGGPALRKAICEKLQRDNGLSFAPNEVVAGMGAKEILFHLALSILNEGDEVLVPTPYWVSYAAHCEAAGAIMKPVEMPFHEAGFVLDPSRLERAQSAKTKMIFLNSPNNPGGYVFTKNDLVGLGEFLLEKNWWIISDEIYEYLSFDNDHISLLSIEPRLRDRFILVNGLSKAFAMTGWRVGYACGPRSVMSLVENLQSQSSTCIPGFIEDAAIFALNSGYKLVESQIADLKRRRGIALEVAERISGISFIRPEGAFYLFIDLRKRLAGANKLREKTSLCFSEYLLENGPVAMVPGEAFGAPGFIRMSYAASEEQITKGLEALGRCLDQLS